MNYFKDDKGVIFAYDNNQVSIGFGADMQEISESEKDEIMAPTKNDLVMINIENAKLAITSALSADIESGGYTWQVRNSIDLQNIQDAIDEHNYAGLEADATQSFRVADNTWQDLTVDKFEKVLSDYRLRKKAIYSSYKAWTDGDMSEGFEV